MWPKDLGLAEGWEVGWGWHSPAWALMGCHFHRYFRVILLLLLALTLLVLARFLLTDLELVTP